MSREDDFLLHNRTQVTLYFLRRVRTDEIKIT